MYDFPKWQLSTSLGVSAGERGSKCWAQHGKTVTTTKKPSGDSSTPELQGSERVPGILWYCPMPAAQGTDRSGTAQEKKEGCRRGPGGPRGCSPVITEGSGTSIFNAQISTGKVIGGPSDQTHTRFRQLCLSS